MGSEARTSTKTPSAWQRLRGWMRGAPEAPAGVVGQYSLGERIGQGGMGVGVPGHAHPARASRRDQDARREASHPARRSALRARGEAHEPPTPSEYGFRLRIRPHARRRPLLRDGISRRARSRAPRRGARPAQPGTRDSRPFAGVRSAPRSARPVAHSPRHQAGQHRARLALSTSRTSSRSSTSGSLALWTARART